MNLIWKNIPNSGSIKSKTITKLLDRFMNRRVELWNDKEIATTLAEPGAIRTAVGRKIWRKIPRKTCVKKLVNKCGCLKRHTLLNRKPKQFLKHRSYTGVLTGVRYNSGCITCILDALYFTYACPLFLNNLAGG